MGGSIDMEQKGCESIGCWTHYVTLSYEITISQVWEGWLTWNKKDVIW